MKKQLRAPHMAFLAATMLAGCANMAGIAPQASLRDAASLGIHPAAAGEAGVDADWWRNLGDPQLDRLVEQALQSNPTLKVAQARLARALAVTEVANAASLPQVNGALDLTRQRYTATGAVPPPLAGAIRESGTAQFTTSWEIDFFGKNQAALDAALDTAQAAQADEQAARSLLTSNVVRAYLQLARVNDLATVSERTLAQRSESLALVQDRVRAGLDTQLELRQSEGALPEARQQLEGLHEQAVLAQNALAALVGEGNRQVVATAPSLSGLKSLPGPRDLPADLLGRRADIAAARWRVEAAGHDVKNAKAQFYPNVNLTAFVGLSSIGLNRLLEAGSQQWGFGPAVRLPIFEAGRLRANLRGKTADFDAAVESYNQAVIDAVRETADQLASARSIERQLTEQQAAQGAAEAAWQIAQQRYKAGLGTYLNVLAAETAVLSQRRLAVDLAARALDAQVGLVRALGGGYSPDRASPALAAR